VSGWRVSVATDAASAQTFERKAALFSLAVSGVLVINLWHHDVGRFNAANYSLLQSVLHVHLMLFHSKP
jgi:protein SEY1